MALVAVCFPTLFALWELFWRTGHGWTRAPDVAGRLAEATDVVSGVTGGAALVGLLLLIQRARVQGTARPLAIAVGLLGGTAALICGGSAIAMYLLTAQETTAITILAWVASGGALLAIIKSATRTLRLSLAAAA